jgi:hypothetical protein
VIAHEVGDVVDTFQDKEFIDIQQRVPRRLLLERLQEMQIDRMLLARDRPVQERDERIGTIGVRRDGLEQRSGVVVIGIQIDVTESDRFVILDPSSQRAQATRE